MSIIIKSDFCVDNWFESAASCLSVDMSSGGWCDLFGKNFADWYLSSGQKKIKTLSLFSGGGGLDIAFSEMGFDIIESVEIEKKFADTLSENSAENGRLFGCTVRCADIRKYFCERDDIEFIIGGPPCQTFSAAGARAAGVMGIDDDRGLLFQEYVRLVKHLKPKGFLFENVYRIVGAQGGKPWQMIQDAFIACGYKLFYRVIDAADYGVPQHRERLIIIGLRDGEYMFPCPTHGPDSKNSRPYFSAGDALNGLPPFVKPGKLGGRHGYLLDDIPNGLNYSFYTEKMGHPKPVFGWRSKFSDYLYKADPESPVRTLKAQGGQYTGPFSWENRPFAVEELKRLQTFPDDYKMFGGRQVVIKQLGNSVPPQLGRVLAISILAQVFHRKLPFKVDLLQHDTKLGFRTRKSKLTGVYAAKADSQIKKLVSSGLCDAEKLSKVFSRRKRYYISVKNDLSVLMSETDSLLDAEIFVTAKKGILTIDVNEVSKALFFSVKIKLAGEVSELLGIREIVINSADKTHKALTVAWKALEAVIREKAHKDDLVQLFGYYQNSAKLDISLEVHHPDLRQNVFWRVATFVSSGKCVGSQMDLGQLTQCYSVSEKDFVACMRSMKDAGYEIRNSRTNPQIQSGCYLIPYQFPTLNERSLQRKTSL